MKTLFVALSLFIGSCGLSPEDDKVEYKDFPPPTPTPPGPTPPAGQTTFADVQKIMTESCGFNGCHSSQAVFIATESGLRSSSAKIRMQNGSMPPRYASNYNLWEDGNRKKIILEYLNR